MQTPLHTITRQRPACSRQRGPRKHTTYDAFSCKYVEGITKQLPPKPFGLDNPRQTARGWCRHKDPAFEPCKSFPPDDWASALHYGYFFFFCVCLTDWRIEITKGLVFVLFQNVAKKNFASTARHSPCGLLCPPGSDTVLLPPARICCHFCHDTFTTGWAGLHLTPHFPHSTTLTHPTENIMAILFCA